MDWARIQESLAPLVVAYGVRLIGVFALFLLAWLVAGWVQNILERAMSRARVDATLTRFLAALTRWTILLLALLACLGIFGVETTSFAATMGAAGLAIGLAFQGTLANFAAGLMLLLFRPFKVGDVIATGGQIGTVDAIEIFATTIDTSDNRRFIIPNSAIFGSVIENITYHPLRRAEVTVGVSYAADIDETRSVLMRAAASVSGRIKDREPAVTLSNLGPSSVDWSVQVWAKSLDYGNVRQALLRAVKMALDEVGIEIPYPQMAIHFQRSDLVEGREAGFASCLEPPARFHKAS